MITYRFKFRPAGLAAAGLAVCLAMTLETAMAASSEWFETEGGRIRVSALEPAPDGTIRAALDIELLPGWKTYWRDPGEAGVPPTFNVDRSQNISAAEIHFPAPERITDAYSTWAGYPYPVVLPITLTQKTPGKKSVVEADVFLGICESICIPLQTSFTLTVDPEKPANSYVKRLVRKAFEALPEEPGPDFDIVGAKVKEADKGFTLSVKLPETDEGSELFVTGPLGWHFTTPQITSFEDNMATFLVEGDGDGSSLSGETVRVVVKASGRSMEKHVTLP